MANSSCCRCRPVAAVVINPIEKMDFASLAMKLPMRVGVVPRSTSVGSTRRSVSYSRVCVVRASVVDSCESSNFARRMEQAWLISQVLLIKIIVVILLLMLCLVIGLKKKFTQIIYLS